MGVYIKGMEMPKSCGNCFFDTHCDNWRLRNWGAPPPDDCPLVPIPPHGRLIDADALKSVLKWHHSVFIGAEDQVEKAQSDALICAISEVVNAPTIIEAEEGE